MIKNSENVDYDDDQLSNSLDDTNLDDLDHISDDETTEGEHNRETIFKAEFNMIITRIKNDVGSGEIYADVDLSNLDIGPVECNLIAKAIIEHFKLTGKPCYVHYINLSGNRICGFDYTKTPPLTEPVENNKKPEMMVESEHPSIHDTSKVIKWEYSGFKKLIKVLKTNKGGCSVYGVNLFRNPIGLIGCSVLKELLEPSRNASLTDLNLSRCSIDTNGLAHLMKGLAKNANLVKLNLRKNPLGGQSAGVLIAKAVSINQCLQFLDIGQTDFDSASICSFVSTVKSINKQNRKLNTLILSENGICDIGAKAVSDLLLSNNMKLLHLDLQGNAITSVGASIIAKGVAKNKFLLYLGLQWNKINNEGAKDLGASLTRNTALKAMFLIGNEITKEGARYIIEGSLTFDDTPVCIDIDTLPARPRGYRIEAEAELEKTKEEAEHEEMFASQEIAFRTDITRNALGEEIEESSQILSNHEGVVEEDSMDLFADPVPQQNETKQEPLGSEDDLNQMLDGSEEEWFLEYQKYLLGHQQEQQEQHEQQE